MTPTGCRLDRGLERPLQRRHGGDVDFAIDGDT
jgi:hypothetical protein